MLALVCSDLSVSLCRSQQKPLNSFYFSLFFLFFFFFSPIYLPFSPLGCLCMGILVAANSRPSLHFCHFSPQCSAQAGPGLSLLRVSTRQKPCDQACLVYSPVSRTCGSWDVQKPSDPHRTWGGICMSPTGCYSKKQNLA